MRSPGVDELRQRFYDHGCKGIKDGQYGHREAYLKTGLRLWDTSAQVGGFAGAHVTSIDGMVEFDIPNVAGRSSFYDGLVNDKSSPWGPERNISQRFKWKEPLNACKCRNP